MRKYLPWTNEHGMAREAIVSEVDDIIQDRSILGYHCTRLHPDEVAGVRRDGLLPLRADLAARRVRARVAAGDLSEQVGDRLLAKSRADDSELPERRTGMIWFVFSAELLREEGGVWRLLAYWGGEALYMAHEDSPVGRVLRSLGTACIVEAAVPVNAIETYCSVGERVVRGFVHRRGIPIEHASSWEGYTRVAIPGEALRVISRGDGEFEHLTGCEGWQNTL